MSFINKILLSFKNIHFQSLVGNIILAIMGMFTMSVIYRYLLLKEIGVYVFFTTILNLFITLRAGFLTNSFITFYSGTKKSRADEVAGSAWCLAFLITVGLILIDIVVYFFSEYISNAGILLFFKYFPFTFLATLPVFMATLVVQSEKRFDRLLWLRLINQVLFTGSIFAMAILGKLTINSIILIYICSNLTASLVTIVLGWTKIYTINHSSKKVIKEIFHFGKYSMGTSISANLFAVTDTFFITFFLGPAVLALYNVGGKLLQIIEVPLLSIVASGMPGLSEHYNNNQIRKMMLSMKKMVGMLSVLFLGIAIFCVIFAEPIIMLLGGSNYIHTDAPNLFRIFMCMAVLYPADRFFALTLDVIHKPKFNFYKILIMLAANLVADFIGLKIFKSVYIVAFANIFPIVLAIIIAYIPLNKFFKFNYWGMYKVGFKELVLQIKVSYKTLLNKKQIIADSQ